MIIYNPNLSKKDGNWHETFVFLPTRLVDGTWVIFESLEKRWVKFTLGSADFSGHSFETESGRWEYKPLYRR